MIRHVLHSPDERTQSSLTYSAGDIRQEPATERLASDLPFEHSYQHNGRSGSRFISSPASSRGLS
jgi:hypothetical protein